MIVLVILYENIFTCTGTGFFRNNKFQLQLSEKHTLDYVILYELINYLVGVYR